MLHLLGMVLREIRQIPQTQLSMDLFTMCLLVAVKEKLLLELLILGQAMFFIDAKKILSVIMGIYFLWANIVEWEDKNDLLRWIDSIIYYSFFKQSIAGVPCCWFVHRVSSIYTPRALPLGLQQYFPTENITRWVVIKHGDKVWPILVTGRNMLNNKWSDFCRVHGLRIGCYVVFACERRWVFNTFMFNENGHEMRYTWSNPAQPLQQLYDRPDDLQTSCFPSLIEQAAPIPKFMCEYTTEMSLNAVCLFDYYKVKIDAEANLLSVSICCLIDLAISIEYICNNVDHSPTPFDITAEASDNLNKPHL